MSYGISYQNKDIASKVFADNCINKSLDVYGLKIPKIVDVMPTNLPEVSANELRIDNLFLLEDGTVAIIDYESTYSKRNKNKYIGYIHRVLDRYFKEGNYDIIIRMIVIYTADVTPEQTDDTFNAGAIKLSIESAYLSKLNSENIRRRLERKVNAGKSLTSEDMMEFIILPLTYTKDLQKMAIENAISMAKEIKDDETMAFVLSGILVFSDKVIDEELSKKTKEWIKMTKVGRLFAKDAEIADAKRMVSIIESILSKGYDLPHACELAGVSTIDYEKAKKFLQSEEIYA